jgi:hypothetical protein
LPLGYTKKSSEYNIKIDIMRWGLRMTVGFNRIRSASDGSVLLPLMNIREFAVGDLV